MKKRRLVKIHFLIFFFQIKGLISVSVHIYLGVNVCYLSKVHVDLELSPYSMF